MNSSALPALPAAAAKCAEMVPAPIAPLKTLVDMELGRSRGGTMMGRRRCADAVPEEISGRAQGLGSIVWRQDAPTDSRAPRAGQARGAPPASYGRGQPGGASGQATS